MKYTVSFHEVSDAMLTQAHRDFFSSVKSVRFKSIRH